MSPAVNSPHDRPGDSSEEMLHASDIENDPIIISSDSEDDFEVPDGYQLLSQSFEFAYHPSVLTSLMQETHVPENGEVVAAAACPDEENTSPSASAVLQLPEKADEEIGVTAPASSSVEGTVHPGTSSQNVSSSPTSFKASSNVEKKSFDMNDDHIKAIKEAMKEFTLPADNIPEWASLVSEDEWKTTLINKINEKLGIRDESKLALLFCSVGQISHGKGDEGNVGNNLLVQASSTSKTDDKTSSISDVSSSSAK